MTELWLSFLAGLAGSVHCLGMCGGIVTALALAGAPQSPQRRFMGQLAYHGGRIATYTLLGLAVGFLAQTALLTALKPYFLWLFAAANAVVMVVGLATVCGVWNFGLSSLDGSGWGFLGAALGRAARRASPGALAAAGLMMGLIPCGMVYGVLLPAATSDSWLKGGAMMLAFGLGTLPALMIYGQLAATLSASFGIMLQRLTGLAVAGLGAFGLWRIVAAMGHYHH
ncbi:sulfite exporter TauE/SafE family protein [Geobacter sp. SVR]|uniref:sulfite exporter TauE/SafE family protein n=1 Tax=Geobacter sp. SVR TaxID=2495594 RepID=UPI00143EF6DA|nr:sulfite exporter TauE/SafE family protein [Geobacter sp. SVR]BCS53414.1 cytochrome biogenesis protein [Geobacter sp. SVR]GCF85460.1 cytochrome biogenesis protein [Geobacter sp. SVR]